MFEALRGPLQVGGRLLLYAIVCGECPQLLALRLIFDLARHAVRDEGRGVSGPTAATVPPLCPRAE
jgi:hypothetical protein